MRSPRSSGIAPTTADRRVATPLLPDDAVDDELQRRIGRNLLVFARIEANLKKLMAVNRISFTLALGMTEEEAAQSMRQSIEGRSNARAGNTLGTLVGRYLREVLPPHPDASQEPGEGQCVFSLGYQRTETTHSAAALTARLATIVDERNALVHHLTDRLGSGTPEDLARTRTWLDAQFALAQEYLSELRDEMRGLHAARLALFEEMRQADWPALLEQAWRAASPLAIHFAAHARAHRRSDGWTDFGQAVQSAHAAIPDELAHLQERHGVARVRPALVATGLFEFTLEPTAGGGQRLLYRPRPDASPQAPLPVP